jgi:5-methyltetrahydrofolate--homocysteine methyltransferase
MISPLEYYKAFLANDDPEKKIRTIIVEDLDKGQKPIDVLFEGLVPALESIGKQFGEGKLFLPELIFSGQLMKELIEWLKDRFDFRDERILGTFVLGTVKGDLHDIGKNLVGMIAQGSGLKVIDLGIDVTTEGFLKAIEDYQPQVIGLSALLTTTMLEMEKTVHAIKKSQFKDSIKIIIGGAPITRAFTERIGADAFGKDAVDGVLKVKDMLY